MIQDNIDEIAEIKYNKINSISSMEYGNYKKVIKKRNKCKQENEDYKIYKHKNILIYY